MTKPNYVYMVWHNDRVLDVYAKFEVAMAVLDDFRKGRRAQKPSMGVEMISGNGNFELRFQASDGTLHRVSVEKRERLEDKRDS